MQFPTTKETETDGRAVYSHREDIAAVGSSFPATTAHGLPPTGAIEDIWVVKVVMEDGTERYTGKSSITNGRKVQMWRVDGTNIEAAALGSPDWTGFTAHVHLEYTLT
jgi:hypothetical protein